MDLVDNPDHSVLAMLALCLPLMIKIITLLHSPRSYLPDDTRISFEDVQNQLQELHCKLDEAQKSYMELLGEEAAVTHWIRAVFALQILLVIWRAVRWFLDRQERHAQRQYDSD